MSRRAQTPVVIIIILVIIIAAAIWVGKQRTKPITTAPIKVGVIGPFGGPLAAYGAEVSRGVLDAKLPNVTFVFEDDQCDATQAVTAVQKLLNVDQVRYFIGPECGSPQEAIAPIVKDRDVVVLLPAAASALLFDQSSGRMYNNQYSLESESAFIADQLYRRGLKRIALISYQNAFSKTHADTFRKSFRGEIVKDVIVSNPQDDLRAILTQLKGLQFDAIYSVDVSFFFANGLERLKQLGITVPVFSQYAVELPAAFPLTEGVIYSYPADITEGVGAVYGLSKDAAILFNKALDRCGDRVDCVRKTIERSGFKEGVKQRGMVLKQIKGGTPVLYR